jgi:hypothetical protein
MYLKPIPAYLVQKELDFAKVNGRNKTFSPVARFSLISKQFMFCERLEYS